MNIALRVGAHAVAGQAGKLLRGAVDLLSVLGRPARNAQTESGVKQSVAIVLPSAEIERALEQTPGLCGAAAGSGQFGKRHIGSNPRGRSRIRDLPERSAPPLSAGALTSGSRQQNRSRRSARGYRAGRLFSGAR